VPKPEVPSLLWQSKCKFRITILADFEVAMSPSSKLNSNGPSHQPWLDEGKVFPPCTLLAVVGFVDTRVGIPERKQKWGGFPGRSHDWLHTNSLSHRASPISQLWVQTDGSFLIVSSFPLGAFTARSALLNCNKARYINLQDNGTVMVGLINDLRYRICYHACRR
jgi:hypothetical protein